MDSGNEELELTRESPLILASASPRRKELLYNVDIPYIVMPSNAPEDTDERDPEKAAEIISSIKAADVADRMIRENVRDTFLILGADTLVSIDGKILGKPENEDEAFKTLSLLQGRKHEVITGVTFAVKRRKEELYYITWHEVTEVELYPVSDEAIREYIKTGEPMDKAGSYGIQGVFARHVKGIVGDYNNVIGLPVGRVFRTIKDIKKHIV
ncbi:MAG: septum formation protein Maf [Lachnospiraceae bacterium]|nr:septum formation protein Maf [Lachnospiraceae bacterium]